MICLAVLGSPHLGLKGCMELKTNKVIENEKQDAIFHKSATPSVAYLPADSNGGRC